MFVYVCIKYDADLVHRLLQYVLSILHQLLHLTEHIVQADRTWLQVVPQNQRPASRHATGRPQQAQAERNREQHDTGHLCFSLYPPLFPSMCVCVCLSFSPPVCKATERCDALRAHSRTQLDSFYLESLRRGGGGGYKLERTRLNGVEKVQIAF